MSSPTQEKSQQTKQKNVTKEEIFEDLKTKVESEDVMPTIVESLCMSCGKNGETRLLLTSIPHFREVIIASFSCPHCGEKNDEIQFGGKYAEKGVHFELSVQKPEVELN